MKNETQEFLDNLDNLTFVSIDGNTLHTSEGFEISYNLKMMSNISKYPIQLLLRICSDGVYITSWGCTSNEDNLTATKWWAKKSSDIHKKMFEATCDKEASLKRKFYQSSIYIDDLRNQVEAFELILEGLSKKYYIFG